jgi:hypothetical protein
MDIATGMLMIWTAIALFIITGVIAGIIIVELISGIRNKISEKVKKDFGVSGKME